MPSSACPRAFAPPHSQTPVPMSLIVTLCSGKGGRGAGVTGRMCVGLSRGTAGLAGMDMARSRMGPRGAELPPTPPVALGSGTSALSRNAGNIFSAADTFCKIQFLRLFSLQKTRPSKCPRGACRGRGRWILSTRGWQEASPPLSPTLSALGGWRQPAENDSQRGQRQDPPLRVPLPVPAPLHQNPVHFQVRKQSSERERHFPKVTQHSKHLSSDRVRLVPLEQAAGWGVGWERKKSRCPGIRMCEGFQQALLDPPGVAGSPELNAPVTASSPAASIFSVRAAGSAERKSRSAGRRGLCYP
jgi:hypothetical protein